jgi:hypothetical protein
LKPSYDACFKEYCLIKVSKWTNIWIEIFLKII